MRMPRPLCSPFVIDVSFFGCQDLLWAVFTAGAVRVEGPMVQIASFREKP
ncbi:hypothetical protein P376_2570 [Streptomyces sp. HCCB10043]|nr:hypothetical protein P376_2570 [Streptomyces sp. HCCB10043]